MESKLWVAVLTVGLTSATGGAGLFAFFSDEATAADNLFNAGTIDLRLNGQDSVSAFIGGSDLKPGDTLAGALELKNVGTLSGSFLDLDVALDIAGDQGPDAQGWLAQFLRIDNLDYGGQALILDDKNGNGYVDLEDWDRHNVGTRDLPDPGALGKSLSLTVTFHETGGNELQGDSASLAFEFYLAQNLAEDLAQTAEAWALGSPMPNARFGAFAGVIGETFYVAGGHNGATDSPTLQAFDTNTGTWSTRASMPGGRYSGHAAGVLDGKLHVVGGWTSSPGLPNTNLWAYDPATDTWSTKASMPTRSACGGGDVINGKLYVITACDGNSGYRNYLHSYDPATNAWTQLAGTPDAHGDGFVAAIDGKLYVAGGVNGAGAPVATFDRYDPATNAWTTLAPMPAARQNGGVGVVNGKLFVVGGIVAGSVVSSTVYYDPISNAWSDGPSAPLGLSQPAAAQMGNTLFLAGGTTGAGPVTDLMVFKW